MLYSYIIPFIPRMLDDCSAICAGDDLDILLREGQLTHKFHLVEFKWSFVFLAHQFHSIRPNCEVEYWDDVTVFRYYLTRKGHLVREW